MFKSFSRSSLHESWGFDLISRSAGPAPLLLTHQAVPRILRTPRAQQPVRRFELAHFSID